MLLLYSPCSFLHKSYTNGQNRKLTPKKYDVTYNPRILKEKKIMTLIICIWHCVFYNKVYITSTLIWPFNLFKGVALITSSYCLEHHKARHGNSFEGTSLQHCPIKWLIGKVSHLVFPYFLVPISLQFSVKAIQDEARIVRSWLTAPSQLLFYGRNSFLHIYGKIHWRHKQANSDNQITNFPPLGTPPHFFGGRQPSHTTLKKEEKHPGKLNF